MRPLPEQVAETRTRREARAAVVLAFLTSRLDIEPTEALRHWLIEPVHVDDLPTLDKPLISGDT